MSEISAEAVACIGHVDQENLMIVMVPPGYYDSAGCSLERAVVYYGKEGDLQPLPLAELPQWYPGSSMWTLRASDVELQVTTIPGRLPRFAWMSHGRNTTVFRRNPRHYLIGGETGNAIRVISKPRRVIYAGTTGIKHVVVTAIDNDASSAELYVSTPSTTDFAVRRPPNEVVPHRQDPWAFHVDVPGDAFTYMDVEVYRKQQIQELGKATARAHFAELALPDRGYVGLMGQVLRPIDHRGVHFNQVEGIAWIP